MTQPTPIGPPSSQTLGPKRMEPAICPVPNDWSRYGLEQIAAMLRRHPRQAGYAAETMWRAIETLCREQADRLQKALKDLAARWPPEQQASIAFQDWGATLVEAMQDTADTASRNRPVASNIWHEIDRARERIEVLMSERARYQEMERSHGSLIANAAHAGNQLLDGDLDLSGWRAALDRDAREVMAHLEQKIYNYARDLYADQPYEPPVAKSRKLPAPGEDGISHGTFGTGWSGGGAALGGGWSGTWAPPGGVPGPDGVPGLGNFPDPAGEPVTGSGPGGKTELDGVLPGPGSGSPVVNPPPGGAFVETPWGRVLAPGGVIGAPAVGGVGVAPPGGPGAVGGPAAAGLVPGTGAAARPAGGPGAVPFVPPMMPGRPSSGTASTTGGRRRRPGLPSVFETPDGPPGVIQPSPEPAEHDPGPGVIGIDR